MPGICPAFFLYGVDRWHLSLNRSPITNGKAFPNLYFEKDPESAYCLLTTDYSLINGYTFMRTAKRTHEYMPATFLGIVAAVELLVKEVDEGTRDYREHSLPKLV
jgi:hypothetical protein